MLKCCVRPLITLVLALVATGVFSTLSPARDLRSHGGSTVTAAESAKPRPVATSGEPDQPLSPVPVPRLTSGLPSPTAIDDGSGGGFWVVFRWTGWVWAYWFARAAL
jgi:hypothetical protein